MSKYFTTYTDKNGSKWTIENGDWIGSFEKERKIDKKFLRRYSIPFLLLVILSLILIGWK